MESVLLAVALLGFGIGGYFVVGRVARFFCHRDLRPVRRERGKIEGAGGHALAVPPVAHPPGAGEAPGEGRKVIPAGGVRAGCQCSLETRRREFCEGRRQTAGFGAAARSIQDADSPPGGRLKIFFGYAAGVGKTYAMLEAAHRAKEAGVDVVAGYIEPHTRPETMALLEGLEVLPTKTVTYKGISLKEFDLDGALARHPQLLLVDELAHTNAAGSRHTKRYQDIQELLRAGISVYTTVNVQHLESLNDVVASITGIAVAERVPDRVFDSAYQVEVVDLEPADLLERLREGKIYRGPPGGPGPGSFFQPEESGRPAGDCPAAHRGPVGERAPVFGGSVKPKAGEHILICLSGAPLQRQGHPHRGPDGQGLSRRRLQHCLWRRRTLPPNRSRTGNACGHHVHLAEELGARIATAYGDDPAVQIAEYARISGVSKMVLGRSPRKQGFYLPGKNLVDRLNELAPDLDIYIIPDQTPGRASGARMSRQSQEKFSPKDAGQDAGNFAAVYPGRCPVQPLGVCQLQCHHALYFGGFGHRHGYHRPELQCGGLGAVGADL